MPSGGFEFYSYIFSIIFLSMMSDKSTVSNLDAWGKCLGILLLFFFQLWPAAPPA